MQKTKCYLAALVSGVLLVTGILAGCGQSKKDDHLTVYLWENRLMKNIAPYIHEQFPDQDIEFIIGNNDTDLYSYFKEHGELPDIMTVRRFSGTDAQDLQPYLMDFASYDVVSKYYSYAVEYYKDTDNEIQWLPICALPQTIIANKTLFDQYGINVPENTTVLIGPQGGVGDGYPLSFEKLTSVLAFYVVNDWHEACELSIELLQNGIGHTMSLHTENKNIVLEFTKKPASRILVNTGSSMGGTGGSTGLIPSFTLGCGTWGGSSVSENVSPMHLVNIKKVAYGIKNCATLAADDPTFNHPELANLNAAPAAGANIGFTPIHPEPIPASGAPMAFDTHTVAPTQVSPANCGSTSAYLSPADYQNNNSGISYGVGCNSCSSNADAPVASDQPIDANQLNDMINALVKAMKGE